MTTNYLIANAIGITISFFNIFVCFKIFKSNIENKLFKVILVCIFNLPTLVVYDSTGWNFNLFQLQILGFGNNFFQLGFRMFFSLNERQLSNYFVFISLPVGAVYVLYNLKSWVRDKEYKDEGI